jgi:hypothetical protein
VELEGLRQTSNGLALPIKATAWEVTSGPDDARLSDQVPYSKLARTKQDSGRVALHAPSEIFESFS